MDQKGRGVDFIMNKFGIKKFAVLLQVVLISTGLLWCGGMVAQAFSEAGVPAVLQKLAAEYTEKGFKLRKEHWRGKLKSGEHKVVKHQLFRGNEYWFWAAVPDDAQSLIVEIFDDSGNAVALEKFTTKGTSGARVLPVKTGTYLVKITVGQQGGKGSSGGVLDWALVYGYR